MEHQAVDRDRVARCVHDVGVHVGDVPVDVGARGVHHRLLHGVAADRDRNPEGLGRPVGRGGHRDQREAGRERGQSSLKCAIPASSLPLHGLVSIPSTPGEAFNRSGSGYVLLLGMSLARPLDSHPRLHRRARLRARRLRAALPLVGRAGPARGPASGETSWSRAPAPASARPHAPSWSRRGRASTFLRAIPSGARQRLSASARRGPARRACGCATSPTSMRCAVSPPSLRPRSPSSPGSSTTPAS